MNGSVVLGLASLRRLFSCVIVASWAGLAGRPSALGEITMVFGFLWFFIMVSTSPLAQTPDSGARTIQLVYESDTRGYYLPCG